MDSNATSPLLENDTGEQINNNTASITTGNDLEMTQLNNVKADVIVNLAPDELSNVAPSETASLNSSSSSQASSSQTSSHNQAPAELISIKLPSWDIQSASLQQIDLKVSEFHKKLYEGQRCIIKPSNLNQFEKESNFMVAIHFASLGDNIENLKDIIENTNNVNAITIEGYNALHVLLKYGNPKNEHFKECFEMLMENIDYNKTDFNNNPPVTYAIHRKLTEIIKRFLEINKDGSETDEVKICNHTYKKKKLCFYIQKLGIKMVKLKLEDLVVELKKILKEDAFKPPPTFVKRLSKQYSEHFDREDGKMNTINKSNQTKCKHELKLYLDYNFVKFLKTNLKRSAFTNYDEEVVNDEENYCIVNLDGLLLNIRKIIKPNFFNKAENIPEETISEIVDTVHKKDEKESYKQMEKLKQLRQLLKAKNEEKFINIATDINKLKEKDDKSNENFNLLQLAVFNNLESVSEMLVHLGYSAYAYKNDNYPITPIEICIRYKYTNIFKVLIEQLEIKTNNVKEAYDIFREICHVHSFEMTESFLKHALLNPNIDKEILKKEIPLDISNGLILTLTEFNVISLADKDIEGNLYINNLNASSLRRHIRTCTTDYKSQTESGTYTMSCNFNYESSMPPIVNSLKIKDRNYSEVEIVSYIAGERPDLYDFLDQPFIKCLVFLKWLIYTKFYVVSLIYHILFSIGLLWYIFDEHPQCIMIILFICISIIKVFKVCLFYMYLKTEFSKGPPELLYRLKCVLKITDVINITNFIIIINTIILFCVDTQYKKNCNVINLLLTAYNLVYSIGSYPSVSTRLRMFHTVSWTYITIIALYFPIILSFGVAFCFMLNDDINQDQENFNSLGTSIFATFIMMVGEVVINISKTSIFTRCIFILFLLFIVIIFMSLMNGLAVSDTQKVQNEANFNALQSQLIFIRCIEIFASCVNDCFLQKIVPKYFIKHIFLFQDDKQLKVTYNSKECFLEVGGMKVKYPNKHEMKTVSHMKQKENKEAANKKQGDKKNDED